MITLLEAYNLEDLPYALDSRARRIQRGYIIEAEVCRTKSALLKLRAISIEETKEAICTDTLHKHH